MDTMAIDWRNSVSAIALGAIVLALVGVFQTEAVRVTPAQPSPTSRRVSGECLGWVGDDCGADVSREKI